MTKLRLAIRAIQGDTAVVYLGMPEPLGKGLKGPVETTLIDCDIRALIKWAREQTEKFPAIKPDLPKSVAEAPLPEPKVEP